MTSSGKPSLWDPVFPDFVPSQPISHCQVLGPADDLCQMPFSHSSLISITFSCMHFSPQIFRSWDFPRPKWKHGEYCKTLRTFHGTPYRQTVHKQLIYATIFSFFPFHGLFGTGACCEALVSLNLDTDQSGFRLSANFLSLPSPVCNIILKRKMQVIVWLKGRYFWHSVQFLGQFR